MAAWTCPRCGTSWSDDSVPCARCAADEIPAGAPPAPVDAAVPQGGLEWGTIRPFGALFEASFGLFRANMGWMLRLTFLSVLPMLPLVFWVAKSYVDWQMAPMMRALGRDMQVFRDAGAPRAEPVDGGAEGAMLAASFLATVAAGFCLQAFWAGGFFGSLAALGRGVKPGLNRAVGAGLSRPLGILGVILWTILRLVPWFLLLIVPGIVKAVAWSLAIPAYVSGQARTPEEALRCSDQATRGRKWVLFGFYVLLWLVSTGVEKILTPSKELQKLLPFPAAMLLLVGMAILQAMVGLIEASGVWLAWADGVARFNPQSPAAPFAYRWGSQAS